MSLVGQLYGTCCVTFAFDYSQDNSCCVVSVSRDSPSVIFTIIECVSIMKQIVLCQKIFVLFLLDLDWLAYSKHFPLFGGNILYRWFEGQMLYNITKRYSHSLDRFNRFSLFIFYIIVKIKAVPEDIITFNI